MQSKCSTPLQNLQVQYYNINVSFCHALLILQAHREVRYWSLPGMNGMKHAVFDGLTCLVKKPWFYQNFSNNSESRLDGCVDSLYEVFHPSLFLYTWPSQECLSAWILQSLSFLKLQWFTEIQDLRSHILLNAVIYILKRMLSHTMLLDIAM